MVPGYLTIHVVVERLPRLGVVLVNGRGRTFYAFLSDKQRAVTCTGACASIWGPFTLSPRQALDSSPSLDEALLGTLPDPEGDRVVTFAGWPLYTYAGDTRAGTANGQGLNSHGGRWYAVSPSGALVAKKR
jgi:predicted lipoprotein with Yx(FWY)xxD motif